jgi:7-cyano-7-deazaguanine synthase
MLAALLGGSSLTDNSISLPLGHYAEESMKSTVVPNRNMILLSLAAGHAISLKFDTVAYAAHAGDHTIYPDCRPEFADAMENALSKADWNKINLHRPFVKMNKSDLVKLGIELGVPFEKTWSCYAGGKLHCGKCGTCVERKEAFELIGLSDPTKYKS